MLLTACLAIAACHPLMLRPFWLLKRFALPEHISRAQIGADGRVKLLPFGDDEVNEVLAFLSLNNCIEKIGVPRDPVHDEGIDLAILQIPAASESVVECRWV